jgi:phage terminase small subunit
MSPDEIRAKAQALKQKGKKIPKSESEKPKSGKDEKPLTAAEEQACQEYILNGGNKSDAFRKSYPHSCKWKEKSVHERASKLFSSVKVESRLAELQAIAAKVAEDNFRVNADYILRRHYDIDNMDFLSILNDDGGFKPVREWPLIFRQYLSGLEIAELMEGRGDERQIVGVLKKIKWPDKMKNLELLGKHKAVCAYREQIGLSDGDGNTLIPALIRLVGPDGK